MSDARVRKSKRKSQKQEREDRVLHAVKYFQGTDRVVCETKPPFKGVERSERRERNERDNYDERKRSRVSLDVFVGLKARSIDLQLGGILWSPSTLLCLRFPSPTQRCSVPRLTSMSSPSSPLSSCDKADRPPTS